MSAIALSHGINANVIRKWLPQLAPGVYIRIMIKVDGVLYWCTTATSGASTYRLN